MEEVDFSVENVIGGDDTISIEWIKNHNDPDIRRAWQILEKYFIECKNTILDLDTSGSPYTFYSKNNVYSNISSIIKKPSFLRLIVSDFNEKGITLHGEKITEEKIKQLIENKDNNGNEEDWIITKVNRLYNMYLKLGHSARITYLANYSLENIIKRYPELKESEQFELFHRTVLLSALLHDAGRFYQAVKYDRFDDGTMIDNEKQIGNLGVDHAIAGYYYSLVSFLSFHEKGDDDEEKKKLISEAIAAVVVKCHQISNGKMDYFDYEGNPQELLSLDFDKLYDFIINAYNVSEKMEMSLEQQALMQEQKALVQSAVDDLEKSMIDGCIDSTNAEGFVYNKQYVIETIISICDELKNNITKVIKSEQQDPNVMINTIIGLMNDSIAKLQNTGEKLPEDAINKVFSRVDLLKNMVNFDVAKSIQDIFKSDKDSINNSIRYFIATALLITTDVDKIDILNQRANGTYPGAESYKMKNVFVFPMIDNKDVKVGGSFLEILNTYFGFNYDLDSIEQGFVLDSKALRVLNNCPSVIKGIIIEEFGREDLFNPELIKDDNVAFLIEKDGISELRKDEKGEYSKVSEKTPTTGVYELLTSNWINYFINDPRWIEGANKNKKEKEKIHIDEDTTFDYIKRKCSDYLRIGIPIEDLNSNLSSYTEEERLEKISTLLFSDGLDERFKKEQDNPGGNGWISKAEESDHIVINPIHALLWHMNQFIMVNARNRDTLEFVKENEILDKIYDRLDERMQQLCKGYMDYCKTFIDYVLEDSKERGINSFSGEYMKKKREEVSKLYGIEKDYKGNKKTN
ncbi:MAG: hypothetical protein IKQ35_01570 [Bacilli bacterium]|nr:hypothetical protein [Bacilli bacterium]